MNRALGPYAWAYWVMVSCNVLVPQIFWFKRMRRNIPVMFVVSILVNVGMWFERFVIIVTSLHRDFLPSSWGYFRPTPVDMLTLDDNDGNLDLILASGFPDDLVEDFSSLVKYQEPLLWQNGAHEHEPTQDNPHQRGPPRSDRRSRKHPDSASDLS